MKANLRADCSAGWPTRLVRTRARRTGSAMITPEVWRQIAVNLDLSTRELQIVRGTFDDQTESTIAAGLHIASSTVHTYIGRLHHKLAVTDRAQLILRVIAEYMALTASPGNRLPPVNANPIPSRRPFRHQLQTTIPAFVTS